MNTSAAFGSICNVLRTFMPPRGHLRTSPTAGIVKAASSASRPNRLRHYGECRQPSPLKWGHPSGPDKGNAPERRTLPVVGRHVGCLQRPCEGIDLRAFEPEIRDGTAEGLNSQDGLAIVDVHHAVARYLPICLATDACDVHKKTVKDSMHELFLSHLFLAPSMPSIGCFQH